MAQVSSFTASARAKTTKGATSAVRKSGNIPAVIYGDKQAPQLIAVENRVLARFLESKSFMTSLFDIEIDGKKHRVLPRDIQFDPVSDRVMHVDFLRVSANTRVRVAIPVVFKNAEKSPGIKRGGTLNIVHHEIEIMCAPDRIPPHFEVSLEGLQINDAVHLSALTLPKDITLTTHEKDYTIATIAVPSAIRSENEEAAAAAAAAAAAPAAEAAAAPVLGPDGKPVAPAAGAAAPAAGAAGAKPGAAPAAAAPAAAAGAAKKPEAKK